MTVDLDRLKVKIMKDHPFFGSLLHNVSWHESTIVPTAMITANHEIHINPKFWSTLNEDQQIFVACHEILHGVFLHVPRTMKQATEEDKRLANHAADYLINCMLVDAGHAMVQGGLYDAAYNPDKYTMETLMDELRKKNYNKHKQQMKLAGASGSGDDAGQGTAAAGGDDMAHSGEQKSPSEQRKEELEARLGLQAAVMMAKKRGKVPGMIERFVAEISKPQQNWKEELREWFNVKLKDDVTWNRPNRRFVAQRKYFPTKWSEGCGHIGVAIDVSGSISQKELARFESELNHIFETCKPSKVTVIYFDTRVHGPDCFDELPIKLRSPGGGGTDFSVAFQWFTDNCSDITGLVFMTDMYCDWPSAPSYPTCILSTTPKMVAPFGKTLYANLKEDY